MRSSGLCLPAGGSTETAPPGEPAPPGDPAQVWSPMEHQRDLGELSLCSPALLGLGHHTGVCARFGSWCCPALPCRGLSDKATLVVSRDSD